MDLVVCALALVHVPALAPVMAEFARVLRAGGHLVISDIHVMSLYLGGVASAAALAVEDLATSDRRPAPEDAGDQRGSEPDKSDTAEFAKMRAVMRASESTGKAGWIQNSRTRTQIPALIPGPTSGGARRKRSSVRAQC